MTDSQKCDTLNAKHCVKFMGNIYIHASICIYFKLWLSTVVHNGYHLCADRGTSSAPTLSARSARCTFASVHPETASRNTMRLWHKKADQKEKGKVICSEWYVSWKGHGKCAEVYFVCSWKPLILYINVYVFLYNTNNNDNNYNGTENHYENDYKHNDIIHNKNANDNNYNYTVILRVF